MQNLWSTDEAETIGVDPLSELIYSSRLLGREPSLVLHGGGNTSVKTTVAGPFGDPEEILFIKGSGGDLATIDAGGFAPVRMATLTKMAELKQLADTAMVRLQRAAMIDPYAPNPSVEAILHAIIPFRFVHHTHADAVVAITNAPSGEQRIRELYGESVLIIPYVMPGFLLARAVHQQTREFDWSRCEGIVLLNHGLFTFGDDAQQSYERTIAMVTQAEQYVESRGVAVGTVEPADLSANLSENDLRELAMIRLAVSRARGGPMLARCDSSQSAIAHSQCDDPGQPGGIGTLTPDHVIRTKRSQVLLADTESAADAIAKYVEDYTAYFHRNDSGVLTMLDPAPRWAVWPGRGVIAFGRSLRDAGIVGDIARHTMRARQWATAIDQWQPLPEADLFAVEYWELEQAKLKKIGAAPPLLGRIALVTGAASGIGRAVAEMLCEQGAVVAALDIAYGADEPAGDMVPLHCDVTDRAQVTNAVDTVVRMFGGLDIVVSNAGIFPPSASIADMDPEIWSRSLDINLTSHQTLLQKTLPYLEAGWQPSVVIVGSKNVSAPGPGASAYSVAKSGLTQLARIAALEWAPKGIRVNTVHPNAVYDTGLWTDEVLAARAMHYGLSVEEYKANNLLKVAVTSRDVAAVVCALSGPQFRCTTGSQIPVDGGNERVI